MVFHCAQLTPPLSAASFLSQLSSALDHALSVRPGAAGASTAAGAPAAGRKQRPHVASATLVRARSIYGYCREEQVFAKLEMYDPRDIKRAAEMLQVRTGRACPLPGITSSCARQYRGSSKHRLGRNAGGCRPAARVPAVRGAHPLLPAVQGAARQLGGALQLLREVLGEGGEVAHTRRCAPIAQPPLSQCPDTPPRARPASADGLQSLRDGAAAGMGGAVPAGHSPAAARRPLAWLAAAAGGAVL